MRRTLLSGLLLLAPLAPLGAQAPCPELEDPSDIDRIVAVVGDSIILFTELQIQCMLYQQQQLEASVDEILQDLVDRQVILQHAVRDSTLIPSDAEVNQAADAEIERRRVAAGSEEAFQQALARENLTLTDVRDRFRNEARTGMILQRYNAQLMQSATPIPVAEAEMREFFEANRAQLQELPEMLTVQQVLIRSGASDSAWAQARQKADSLYALILAGADFAELATEHSEDEGSAVQGGDLGWVPRGMMVGDFERAAFALMDGATTPPVRSEYGYHIIRAERSRPTTGEKRLRHILISPETSEGDLERAREIGEEVARRIREGESAFSLAQQYGDPEVPREFVFRRGVENPGIPEPFVPLLADATEGELIGPLEANFGFDYVAVLHVTELREAGEVTFEDVRDQIREILVARKQQERIMSDLRERTYIDIRY